MSDHVSTLREIVRRIVASTQPEKIILFGSLARGEAGPDSDIDLLIVAETTERPTRRAIIFSRCIRPRLVPMDIIVYTPAEAALYENEKGSFYEHVVRTGKVIYDRAA